MSNRDRRIPTNAAFSRARENVAADAASTSSQENPDANAGSARRGRRTNAGASRGALPNVQAAPVCLPSFPLLRYTAHVTYH